MSGGLLEPTLRDILRVINPLKEDWSIRFSVINELRAVVQSIESLRGATVEPFGSFVSNLFTRWGDLDISIELSNGSHISSAGKKHKQTLLGDVLRALRSKGGWHKLHFIGNARIPILKFETIHNISCDVSINNLSGQMKSKLLFWINEIDGRFRDMVLLVKEWAKAHNINDPKSGTLNSYSLSLLVVFHFQTCVPAIFPPLKEIYPGNMVDDLIGVRALAEKQVEETCAVNINRYRSDRSRSINRSSLSQLFMSFLEKIEDPFEQPVNTARTVGDKQLERISEAFQTTINTLSAANQDQKVLVSTLVRPQISRFVANPPVRYRSTYSNGTQPQIQRPMQPAVRVPRLFQNRRNEKRQIETNQRPLQAVHTPKIYSPVQPVWRPRSET